VFIVIFRAKIRRFDAEYTETAARMRELALSRFGCLDFQAVSEGDVEIALSYWPDEESIRAWKAHPEHVAAQRKGKERWYASCEVQIAELVREYSVVI
jgi:heme-degrading monooxygenase HmoA